MAQKKHRVILIATILIFVAFIALEQLTMMEVERKDYRRLTLHEYVNNGKKYLRLQGAPYSSVTTNICHVRMHITHGTIFLHTYIEGLPLWPIRMLYGRERPLDHTLTLTPDVKKVVLGKNNIEIWPVDRIKQQYPETSE